mgnify:CR=1 FL=1
MTEITRVPLQPIAKGALTKLWLGVAAVALAAGGVVAASLPPSVSVETVQAGSGAAPTEADVVTINYKGTLPDGKVVKLDVAKPNAVENLLASVVRRVPEDAQPYAVRYRGHMANPDEAAIKDFYEGALSWFFGHAVRRWAAPRRAIVACFLCPAPLS